MTALGLAIAIGFLAGWWSAAAYRVLKRQLSRQARRARHVEPTEFSAFWDGR